MARGLGRVATAVALRVSVSAAVGALGLTGVLGGCGAQTGSVSSDAPPADTPADAESTACLMGAGWVAEAVTNTPATGTYSGKLAFTASGAMWIAFAEPKPNEVSDQDIFTTRLTSCAWSPPERRHIESTYQFAFPSLVGHGERLHLAFNGLFDASATRNDIFYAAHDGSWSAAFPLTSTPAGTGAGAYHPVLAVSPKSSAVSVAFLFAGGTTPIPVEVHVATVGIGKIEGEVIPMTGFASGCDNPQLVYDSKGTRHLVALCGSAGEDRVYYTNDATGTFAAPTPIDGVVGVANYNPSLHLGPDGLTLHLAWRRDIACAATTCAEVHYTRRVGTAWSTPVAVNNKSVAGERFPTIAVLPSGGVVIAFERSNTMGNSDIFVAASTDGVTFTETLVTPGTDETSEVIPASMVVDPTSGRPHFTFTKVTSADPFNMEVWRAELTTPALP